LSKIDIFLINKQMSKKISKKNKNSSQPSTNELEKSDSYKNLFENTKGSEALKRPVIQVENLVKKYGQVKAVDGVSFKVKRGEVFGILGPNGAGKTTLIEIMETILPKTSGWVAIDGLDIDIYPNQIKQTIGIQLQEGGFFSKLNLVESLSFFADIYNVSINPSQFLEKFGLLDKAKNTVEELSGGQRQLFSIASTLVADPTLIFLDEPTTGLDPQARRNLWQIIENFKKQDKTVVLTTHYMEEAQKLCDRVAIMDLGKIIEINTTEGFIQELENKGFKPQVEIKTSITLEDVFLDLTGKQWRS